MINSALAYAAAGWHVFPCAPGGKEPALPGRGHLDATTDPATITGWWNLFPAANIGVNLAASGLVAIDPDLYKPTCQWSVFSQGLEIPETYTQRTGRGGLHLIYSAPPDAEFVGKLCEGVEIKHRGYVVAAPSIVAGNQYIVTDNRAPAPAPDWIPRRVLGTTNPDLQAASVEDVRAALSVIPNDSTDWDWWSRVAGAVWNASGGSDEAFTAFDAWSRLCPAYDEKETATKWRQVQRSPYRDVGMGSLFHLAVEADPSWQRPSRIAGAFTPGAPLAVAPQSLTTTTAAALMSTEFPPVAWVIDRYLPEGLTILAGKPKLGKSWMALDWALAVAGNGQALGRPVQHGDVLYAALEDNFRRLQARVKRMMPFGGAPERLTLAIQWARLDDGGVDAVRAWIEAADAPRLVIIDTLAKVRGASNAKDSAYDADSNALSALHALANEKGIAIVVVHHVRKMAADDPLDTVSGTLGLTGTADTTLVLDRSTSGVTFYGRGRDLEDFEIAVEFTANSCRWRVIGDANEVRRSDERTTILTALSESGESMSPQEIAGVTGMKAGNLRRMLPKMVKAGEVTKVGRGKYEICADAAAPKDPGNIGNNGNDHPSMISADVTASPTPVTIKH